MVIVFLWDPLVPCPIRIFFEIIQVECVCLGNVSHIGFLDLFDSGSKKEVKPITHYNV